MQADETGGDGRTYAILRWYFVGGGALVIQTRLGIDVDDVVDRWVGPQGEESGKCVSSVLKHAQYDSSGRSSSADMYAKISKVVHNMTGHCRLVDKN